MSRTFTGQMLESQPRCVIDSYSWRQEDNCQQQGKATLDVNDTDQLGQIGSISSASSISPLRLPSTMSSISPPRSPCLLRINLSMDKKYDTERLEHGSPSASMITEEAATGLGETYADRAIIHPSAVRSPANIPLPRSPETGMRSGTVSLDVTERPNNSIWSPFGEPGFVAVAYSMLQKTPEALAQRLRSEGIGRDLWKQLGLPKETAPPQVFEPYNEMEMLDLFAAIADIAKAPSAFPHSSLHVATPMGHGYEQICDLDNFTTFNGQRSPLSVRGQSQGENASRNGAVTVGSASSSPLSVFSSRRSSQGRLATPLPSRQVSSHDVFTNNQPTPDVIPLSRLDSIPRKAGPGSDSEHQSAASEIQLSTSIHSKSSQIRSTSTHTRYADPDVKTTAVPTLAMLTRRESSDESQVTQVTAASSASSSRSASELGPAETEAGPNVKCQHPQVDVSKTLLGARSASVNNK